MKIQKLFINLSRISGLFNINTRPVFMRVIPNKEFIENVDQLLSEGKSVELRCLGSSMQPYLRGDGSEVIVASPFSPDELIPGAIVLFHYRGKYICHRVVKREEEKLMIQGDGVIKRQEQVLLSDVVGIIRIIIRRSKKPVSTQTKAAQWYWRCWRRLSPVRRPLLLGYRLALKIIRFCYPSKS